MQLIHDWLKQGKNGDNAIVYAGCKEDVEEIRKLLKANGDRVKATLTCDGVKYRVMLVRGCKP